MKQFACIVNDISAIIAFIFTSLPQLFSWFLGIQSFELVETKSYAILFPFFASIFLLQWLGFKKNKPDKLKIFEVAELLSTAINTILIILTVVFAFAIFQFESKSFIKVTYFMINFIPAGMLFPAAISQTARVIESLSKERIILYFAANVTLVLLLSVDFVSLSSIWKVKLFMFSLLFLIVHCPTRIFSSEIKRLEEKDIN